VVNAVALYDEYGTVVLAAVFPPADECWGRLGK
jgi:hypothetical protein